MIEILDERIEYYSGGEEMKSISECVCDERIVKELQHIKELVGEDRFTIEEIHNYIMSQDSMGDIAYFLSAENIRNANEKPEDDVEEI